MIGLEEIHKVTGFKLGTLPVRYLGVPLATRKLRDCATLVEKITARITCWSSRHLSYAGRLQLIKAVLFSIQNYWCRNFLLPKGVLNKINKLCAGFFWTGKEGSSRGARVNWKDICYPKNERGLGLKDSVN